MTHDPNDDDCACETCKRNDRQAVADVKATGRSSTMRRIQELVARRRKRAQA